MASLAHTKYPDSRQLSNIIFFFHFADFYIQIDQKRDELTPALFVILLTKYWQNVLEYTADICNICNTIDENTAIDMLTWLGSLELRRQSTDYIINLLFHFADFYIHINQKRDELTAALFVLLILLMETLAECTRIQLDEYHFSQLLSFGSSMM